MTAVLPARTISDDLLGFDHERVVAATGTRSGLSMIVAVHSTKLGPALGGCRLWSYDSWADGLADALRLSRGMTSKNALAGLDAGELSAAAQEDPNTVLFRCDVLGSNSREIIKRDISSADLAESGGVIRLEFELDELEFGIQARCSSFGAGDVECALPVIIV